VVALKEMLREGRAELGEQEAQYDALDGQTQELIEQTKRMEELHKDLQADFERTLEGARETEARLAEVEKERDALGRQVEADVARYGEEVRRWEAAVQREKELTCAAEEEVRALKRALGEEESKVLESQAAIEELRRDVAKAAEGAEDLQKRLEVEAGDRASLQKHAEQLEGTLQERDHDVELGRLQARNCQARVVSLEREVEAAQDTLRIAEGKVKAVERDKEALGSEVSQLKKEAVERRKELSELRSSQEILSTDLQQCTRQLKAAQAQVRALERENTDLENELSMKQKRLKDLDAALFEADQQIRDLTRRVGVGGVGGLVVGLPSVSGVSSMSSPRDFGDDLGLGEGPLVVGNGEPLTVSPRQLAHAYSRVSPEPRAKRSGSTSPHRFVTTPRGSPSHPRETERDGAGRRGEREGGRGGGGAEAAGAGGGERRAVGPYVQRERAATHGDTGGELADGGHARRSLVLPTGPAASKAAAAQARAAELTRVIQEQALERHGQRQRNSVLSRGSVRSSLGGVFGRGREEAGGGGGRPGWGAAERVCKMRMWRIAMCRRLMTTRPCTPRRARWGVGRGALGRLSTRPTSRGRR
jgi:hypothetical protein